MKPKNAALAVERLLFWAFLALLVWIPIPLGSNRPWAWALLEIWAFALLGAWLIAWALKLAGVSEALRASWPAWIVLAFWLALHVAHVIPLAPEVVAAVSPESARVQALVSDLGVQRATMTLSIDPHASTVALLKTLAYMATFFLALALVSSRPRLLTLARVLVYAALAHAVYAVAMHASGAHVEYLGTVIAHKEASGTYANRNHFAGFLEMSLAVGIGLLIAGLSDRSADSWRKFVRYTLDWILSPKMVLRLALCVLVIALTTTHSRMGNTAFFSSLLIAGVIGIVLSRHATRNTVILLASLIVIDLLIVGSWFGMEKLAQRIEETTAQEVQEREDPAAYSIDLIKDYALVGAGPGTFYMAFPRYRPDKVVNFYDYAHNDYAQFASETGLLGLGLMGVLVAMALGAALAAQWRRRDPLMRGMSFACIMGVTSLLIHSGVDFNLQIPANAVLFMVMLALGWISLTIDRHGAGEQAGASVRKVPA